MKNKKCKENFIKKHLFGIKTVMLSFLYFKLHFYI